MNHNFHTSEAANISEVTQECLAYLLERARDFGTNHEDLILACMAIMTEATRTQKYLRGLNN